jgi:hypothetical protein
MNRTLRGITIDKSDDWKNVNDSIRVTRHFVSNDMDESARQNEKHSEPRISTLRGSTIDSTDEHENVFDSISANREFDSNEMDERQPQYAKQKEPKISISCGTRTFDDIEQLRINL